eukprot:756798-Hanusia_phi.AAC.1
MESNGEASGQSDTTLVRAGEAEDGGGEAKPGERGRQRAWRRRGEMEGKGRENRGGEMRWWLSRRGEGGWEGR